MEYSGTPFQQSTKTSRRSDQNCEPRKLHPKDCAELGTARSTFSTVFWSVLPNAQECKSTLNHPAGTAQHVLNCSDVGPSLVFQECRSEPTDVILPPRSLIGL
ncbi:hypothetical protein TNCV_4165481 [Trichonephila clavipes]|nr:hypothetical protein TNCV_4165481 [Trichonephila clavipes]